METSDNDPVRKALVSIEKAVTSMSEASGNLYEAHQLLEHTGYAQTDRGAHLVERLGELREEMAGFAHEAGMAAGDLMRRSTMARLGKKTI